MCLGKGAGDARTHSRGGRLGHRRLIIGGRCTEPIADYVNRTLEFVWKHSPLPPHPVSLSAAAVGGGSGEGRRFRDGRRRAAAVAVPTRLILLTVSFPHAVQLHKLRDFRWQGTAETVSAETQALQLRARQMSTQW